MFKNYLKVYPSGVQLALFGCFFLLSWSLFIYAMPMMIRYGTGQNMTSSDFLEKGFLDYPVLYTIINCLSLVLTFLLPCIIFAYLAHPRPAYYLGYRKPPYAGSVFWIVVMAVGMLLAITVLLSWIQLIDLGAWADSLQQDRQELEALYFNNKSISALLLNTFLVAFIPAVCEETFFRAVLMRFLNTWFRRPWLSIVCSALLFALVHLSVYNFIPIFITGVLLAWTYFKTSSLWLNICLHFLFNGAQVILAYVLNKDAGFDENTSAGMQIGMFLIGSALIATAMYFISKHRRPLPDNWSVVEQAPPVNERPTDSFHQ
jgi:membrane protease YdiL (CAAX protease family)